MARTVWVKPDEQIAFSLGQEAARAGMPRLPWVRCKSYNERAAFNDGWDFVMDPPKPKRRGNARQMEAGAALGQR